MTSTSPLTEPFVAWVDPDALTEFCARAMTSVGMADDDARLTAEMLVRTDVRGIYTHGTVSLRRYVQLMRDGGINPRAVPEVTAEGPSWARMDAHQAVGMVAGSAGMRQALTKADATGVGMATVRRSNHFGAASAYALLALEHSMIGVAMTNGDVVMNIPGGRGAMMGNCPLSYAVPAGTQPPMVLDIAMSTVAGGKVVSFRDIGRALPEGWLTDGEGLPTTDPSVFAKEGALTPLGEHKGYGLALMVEMLAGVVSGSALTSDIVSWARESTVPCDVGHAFLAINVAAMMPFAEFTDRMDELIRRMRTAPKAKGVDRTYVPGEMEWDNEQLAKAHGVRLTDMAVKHLTGLADDLGLRDALPFA